MNYKVVLSIIVITVITALSLMPVLKSDFVMWDDDEYVLNNKFIRSLSFDNLKNIFSRGFVGCYCPFAILTYSLEYRFFNLNPFWYHLTNYMLHIVNTLLVFCIIYLISRNVLASFLVSILFGIHPIHVQSVAWISERKDLLCALFYLSAIISYLFYLRKKKSHFYVLTFAFVIFSLFSKPMAVTLPVILLLFDYLNNRKIDGVCIMEKIPLFVVALIFGGVNFYFQKLTGTTALYEAPLVRAYFLSKTIPFYLYKLILPVNLSAIYPYTDVGPYHLSQIKFYLAFLAFIGISIIYSLKFTKKVVFGSFFFLFSIAPVLKIIPAGSEFAADRYMYLPSIGLFYIGALGIEFLISRKSKYERMVKSAVFTIMGLAVAISSYLTFQQSTIWKDSKTLFLDVIEKYPEGPFSYINVGNAYLRSGDVDSATFHFKKVVSVRPSFELGWYNLGVAYRVKGRPNKASACFEKALFLKPDYDDARAALAGISREMPVPIDRESAEGYNEIGLYFGKTGRVDLAMEAFKRATEADPGFAEAHNNLAFGYYRKGEAEKAIELFKKAIRADPTYKRAYENLSAIYMELGDIESARKYERKLQGLY